MGFLKSAMNDEEPEEDGGPQGREEDYERLFMKIGRDFLHRDDFIRVMTDVMDRLRDIDSNVESIDFVSDTEAHSRALEYKHYLDNGLDGSIAYRDLINLDDE